jgi:tetratricopeptide (TPR) repeat protein
VATALDPGARRDLGGLQKDLAESVARHLVAAGSLVDDDPQAALAHARYARRRASRIAVVREAAGIAAYHAGEWAEALAELRAARRMGGGPGHLAVMADIERAMERPERALELARGPEARELGRSAQVELAIVVAGARRDLGEFDAAVVGLQIPELDPAHRDPWSARLFYAYADNLLAAGRESDALQWFVHAVDADVDGQTDAEVRVAELTGEPLPDEGIEFGVDDEHIDDDLDDAENIDDADSTDDADSIDDPDSIDDDDDLDDADSIEDDDDDDDDDDEVEVEVVIEVLDDPADDHNGSGVTAESDAGDSDVDADESIVDHPAPVVASSVAGGPDEKAEATEVAEVEAADEATSPAAALETDVEEAAVDHDGPDAAAESDGGRAREADVEAEVTDEGPTRSDLAEAAAADDPDWTELTDLPTSVPGGAAGR